MSTPERPVANIWVPAILVPSVQPPLDPDSSPRRRVAVTITLIIGTLLLAGTLSAPRGSASFYVLGLLVAATWVVGSVASGPLPLGHRGGAPGNPRALVEPIVLGVVAFAFFLGADLIVRHLPVLGSAIGKALATADAGPRIPVLLVAVVNGVAEETFFRGALHSALGGRRPGLWATAAYVVATVATFNAALIVAAAVMGTVFTLERLSSRGILAPILTHVAWTILTVLALPR
jgi:membrane protease YdiL (CAAX protease family)